MPLSTDNIVRETHRLALQEAVKKGLKTQPEFARYVAIATESAERVDAEKDAFRTDYHARLAEAREVVLREQTARALEHPKPDWAVDTPPSAEKIDLMARNRVQADHEQRITAIRTDELDQYGTLWNECRARDARETHARSIRQNHAKDAFNLTNKTSPHEAQTGGRSGPSRS